MYDVTLQQSEYLNRPIADSLTLTLSGLDSRVAEKIAKLSVVREDVLGKISMKMSYTQPSKLPRPEIKNKQRK